MDVTPIFYHSFKSPWLQYWWAGGWIEKKHLYTNTLAVYNLWSLLVKNLSNCCPETHNWRVIMDILFIMFLIIFVNRKKFKKLWMRCAVCFLTRSRQRWVIIINSHISLSPWSSISGLDASSVMPLDGKNFVCDEMFFMVEQGICSVINVDYGRSEVSKICCCCC